MSPNAYHQKSYLSRARLSARHPNRRGGSFLCALDYGVVGARGLGVRLNGAVVALHVEGDLAAVMVHDVIVSTSYTLA